ncbi:hypothetical protein GGR92_001220 [Spirosoma lacussanchae]|uniref:COG2958 family protein n=1 Tax=Spirosoma lacussanchae TaxID=1884249 RepID=UPI0011084573|nr:HrgA protein [Spirosoma lacussanchae]
MALNLTKLVTGFLQERAEQKFTTREIATWIFSTYPEECKEKQQRSKATVAPLLTDDDLIAQIAAEISSQGQRLQEKLPQIKTTEGRPRRYYYTSQTDQAEVSQIETGNVLVIKELPSPSVNEHALYPKLAEFIYLELKVHSKRIDEKKSSNRQGPGGNKWLYPDVVGMEILSSDWHQEVIDCVKQYADRKTKLWSFEVKLLVNRSNVREVFFQTVSNSSWANMAYLVAAEFEGRDTIKELRMLTSLHGLGVIRLNAENPAESEILIPAKERVDIDWNTVNRLVEENTDFRQYIRLVRQFYQTNDPRPKDWDYAPA